MPLRNLKKESLLSLRPYVFLISLHFFLKDDPQKIVKSILMKLGMNEMSWWIGRMMILYAT